MDQRRCAKCDNTYDAQYDACPHCARTGDVVPPATSLSATVADAGTKHPAIGYYSVIASGFAVASIFVMFPLLQTRDLTQWGMMNAMAVLGVVLALTGIVTGLIGLRRPRKALPAIGATLGALYFVLWILLLWLG